MYYPEELVEEIRVKNDIVDVISGYLTLQKKGGNHWACCPFHNEKTPSFSVSGNKQMFHCFGCGVSGNVYTFIMKYENYSFQEAAKMLADRAGVQLPEMEYNEEMRRRENKRARLLEVSKEAAKFFYYQLRSPRGKIGYDYLNQRGLSDETKHKFGLGYAGKSGAELVQYLRSKGFEDEVIKEAGLANYSEKRGLLSQFWNRVMYPIQDINHRVIGFWGRVMGEGEPKYLNSPETPIFDKRRNLYGLNFARTAKRKYYSLRRVYGCDRHASGGFYAGGGFSWDGVHTGAGGSSQAVYGQCPFGLRQRRGGRESRTSGNRHPEGSGIECKGD